MKIYYSGALNHSHILERNDIKKILISIHGQPNIYKKIKKNEWMIDGTRELMIDNGAFSAWNSGKKIITVEEYTDFCKKFHDEFSPFFESIYYIGLDHIPGEKNTKPSKEQVDKACDITMSNYQYMTNNGVKNVLPVVHQFEDVEWVKKYEEYTDFICLSPANDQSNKSRAKWLDEVYSIINPKTKTHGLAATGKYLVKRYSWYSTDSISWLKPFVFGQVFEWEFFELNLHRFVTLNKNEIWRLKLYEIFLSYFNDDLSQQEKSDYHMDYHIKQYKTLENYITQLWAKRGIVWDEKL